MFLIFNIKEIIMCRTFFKKVSINHEDIKLITENDNDFIEIILADGTILNTNSYTLEELTEKINDLEKLNMDTED